MADHARAAGAVHDVDRLLQLLLEQTADDAGGGVGAAAGAPRHDQRDRTLRPGGLRRAGGEGEAGREHGERTARDGCHRRLLPNLSDNFASMARHLQSMPERSDIGASRCEYAFRGRRCYSEGEGCFHAASKSARRAAAARCRAGLCAMGAQAADQDPGRLRAGRHRRYHRSDCGRHHPAPARLSRHRRQQDRCRRLHSAEAGRAIAA